jgi:acetoin utilization protein AcuB
MILRDFDRVPSVGAVMTPFPYFIESKEPVTTADARMVEHEIRHLPVLDNGEVVGIITDRDLKRLVHPSLPLVNKSKIRARDVMQRNVYVTDIHTPLDEVLDQMVERRIGSCVVLRHGKLAGIFSMVDACRVLAGVLAERFPSGPGNAA